MKYMYCMQKDWAQGKDRAVEKGVNEDLANAPDSFVIRFHSRLTMLIVWISTPLCFVLCSNF